MRANVMQRVPPAAAPLPAASWELRTHQRAAGEGSCCSQRWPACLLATCCLPRPYRWRTPRASSTWWGYLLPACPPVQVVDAQGQQYLVGKVYIKPGTLPYNPSPFTVMSFHFVLLQVRCCAAGVVPAAKQPKQPPFAGHGDVMRCSTACAAAQWACCA